MIYRRLVLLTLVSIFCSSLLASPVKTVRYVDLERYMGTWYEIASYPQWFQKNCTATEANYRLKEDGEVEVINRCHLNDPSGEVKEAKARAWVVDRPEPAKLKVQFFPKWPKVPFLAGNYWIIILDERDYRYAVVSDPKQQTLWILSRTKTMDDEVLNSILNELDQRGFQVNRLQFTWHQ